MLFPCIVFAGDRDLQMPYTNAKPLYFIENKGQIKDADGIFPPMFYTLLNRMIFPFLFIGMELVMFFNR